MNHLTPKTLRGKEFLAVMLFTRMQNGGKTTRLERLIACMSELFVRHIEPGVFQFYMASRFDANDVPDNIFLEAARSATGKLFLRVERLRIAGTAQRPLQPPPDPSVSERQQPTVFSPYGFRLWTDAYSNKLRVATKPNELSPDEDLEARLRQHLEGPLFASMARVPDANAAKLAAEIVTETYFKAVRAALEGKWELHTQLLPLLELFNRGIVPVGERFTDQVRALVTFID
jgi:hypothetical protein